MKYLAVKDNISTVVLSNKHNINDFCDFGFRVHVKSNVECYGWVDMTVELSKDTQARLGVIPA